MASVIKSMTFDSSDALALAGFWAATLGTDVDEDAISLGVAHGTRAQYRHSQRQASDRQSDRLGPR